LKSFRLPFSHRGQFLLWSFLLLFPHRGQFSSVVLSSVLFAPTGRWTAPMRSLCHQSDKTTSAQRSRGCWALASRAARPCLQPSRPSVSVAPSRIKPLAPELRGCGLTSLCKTMSTLSVGASAECQWAEVGCINYDERAHRVSRVERASGERVRSGVGDGVSVWDHKFLVQIVF